MLKQVIFLYFSLNFPPTLCRSSDYLEFLNNPDQEIIHLPLEFPVLEAITEDGKEVTEIAIEFSAFGRLISMKLRKNDNLISPIFKTNIIDGDNVITFPYNKSTCHYLHEEPSMIAAINNCRNKSISGFIFFDNTTFEINPLYDLVEEPLLWEEHLSNSPDYHVPHLIKRATISKIDLRNDAFYADEETSTDNRKYLRSKRNNEKYSGKVTDLTLEVALFFDEAAYKIFSPHLSYSDENLRDMLLAYLNAVQALYKHPSIGNPLNFILVRMDIMKVQPAKLPHHNGERSDLLTSFCEYQEAINPKSDEDDDHWDMGLYISGLDFFAYENGKKSSATMGLATVGGVCLTRYACIIAELGTTNILGKPYPSAGFTSVYILAHEIGHNLGMRHDSSGNSCSKEGYIMSPSRGTHGETQWSSCSAEVMTNLGWANCLKDKGNQRKHLNHYKFMESPGRVYTAKRQCEILLRDKDAYVVPEEDLSIICYSLRCKTPHRSGYYFAGPALEGTHCGQKLYCHGGDCIEKSPKPIEVIPGGWGQWKVGECKSGCLEKSKGYQIKERKCNNPTPVNTDKGCEGSSYQHALCKDTKICKLKRKTAISYASEKCKMFANKIPELDPAGAGLQSTHEHNRLWMGCAVFCRRREGSYYTPRIELNDLGIDAYFPDGTWCHNENGVDYYCNHHHCLPENFELSKTWFLDGTDNDFPQNALPREPVPQELKPYFSLGSNGKPLQVNPDFHINLSREEEWETDDYVLLPDHKLNEI